MKITTPVQKSRMVKVYTDLAQMYPLTPLIQELFILGESEVERLQEAAETVTNVVSLNYHIHHCPNTGLDGLWEAAGHPFGSHRHFTK